MRFQGGCTHPKNVFQICDENFCPRENPTICSYNRKKVKVNSSSLSEKTIPSDQ